MTDSPSPDEVAARYLGAENVNASRDYLRNIDPSLERYITDFVYGQVYAGPTLDPKTRALITVALLAATGNPLQLSVYVRASLRIGASEEEVREVLRQVAVYAGFPAAWNALATANKVFAAAALDATAGSDDAATSSG
jgi:4-carboxymuconolactone decarboxylase